MTVRRSLLVLVSILTTLASSALAFAQPAQDEIPLEDYDAPRAAREGEVLIVARMPKFLVVEFGPGKGADIFGAVKLYDKERASAARAAGLPLKEMELWEKVRAVRDYNHQNLGHLADRCYVRVSGHKYEWRSSGFGPPKISEIFALKGCQPENSSVNVRPGRLGRIKIPLVRTVSQLEFLACADKADSAESKACFCELHAVKHDLDPKTVCLTAPASVGAATTADPLQAGSKGSKSTPVPVIVPGHAPRLPDGLSFKQVYLVLALGVAFATLASAILWNLRRIWDCIKSWLTGQPVPHTLEQILQNDNAMLLANLQDQREALRVALSDRTLALKEVDMLVAKRNELTQANAALGTDNAKLAEANATLEREKAELSKDKLVQQLKKEMEDAQRRFAALNEQNLAQTQERVREIAELQAANAALYTSYQEVNGRLVALQGSAHQLTILESAPREANDNETTRLMPLANPAAMAAAMRPPAVGSYSQVMPQEGPRSRRIDQYKDQLAAVMRERDEAFGERDEVQAHCYKLTQKIVAFDNAARNFVASMELDTPDWGRRRQDLVGRYGEMVAVCAPQRGADSSFARAADLVFARPPQVVSVHSSAAPMTEPMEPAPATSRSGHEGPREESSVSQVVPLPETREAQIENLARKLCEELEREPFGITGRMVSYSRRIGKCLAFATEEVVRVLAKDADDLQLLLEEFNRPREVRVLAMDIGLFDQHTALSLSPPPKDAAQQGTACAQEG